VVDLTISVCIVEFSQFLFQIEVWSLKSAVDSSLLMQYWLADAHEPVHCPKTWQNAFELLGLKWLRLHHCMAVHLFEKKLWMTSKPIFFHDFITSVLSYLAWAIYRVLNPSIT